MENPTEEITQVVHTLCQGTPDQQTEAINTYFTPNASFTHPFCRTGSFDGSRNLIHAIYKWYKLLSPKIELNVNSIGKFQPPNPINPQYQLTTSPPPAYDSQNLILYLNITQIFSIWLIPFHHANVTLTTELQLTRPPNSRKHYISAQNDLYQNDQLIRFLMPWGLGELSVHLWQYSSTMMCVLGSFLLAPATRLQQSWLDERERNGRGSAAVGGSVSRAEDEMRSLVSSAMEGVGHKRPEGRKRQSSNAGAGGDRGSGDGAGAGASSGASSNGGGVQQFGNMQVVT